MPEKLVFDDPVVLIGGANVNMDELARLSHLPLVAADGGANHLYNSTLVPEVIVGDLDSLQNRDYWQSVTRLQQITEQDTTDFEKCLYTIDAPVYLAMGFLGGQLDHTLAALHTVQKYYPLKSVMLISNEDVMLACSADLRLSVPAGLRVSVYPLAKTGFKSSLGLQYPLDGLTMQQGELIGTSNSSSQSTIEIQVEYGIYALILSLDCLPYLLAEYQILLK